MSIAVDDGVLVAVSGGADSVYLARRLVAERGTAALTLAHFEHDLQSDGADALALTRRLADKLGCDLITEKWATPDSSEAAARTARYDFLQRAARLSGAQWVATGHHADDQTETILLNFLRGCGARGLGGMREFDSQRRLWRPLLTTTRAQIECRCTAQDWEFYTDPSNADTRYARNWLRGELLPQITTRYPQFGERLRAAAGDWQNSVEADIKQARVFLKTQSDSRGIARQQFCALNCTLQSAVLNALFAPRSLAREQLAALRKFIATAATGKCHEINGRTLRVFAEVFTVGDCE